MRRRGSIAVTATIAAISLALPLGSVRADSADLRLHRFPTITPESLAMRMFASQDVETPAPLDPEVGKDVEVLELDASLAEEVRASDALGARRSLDEKVVLQVSLGVGIDGGQPQEVPILSSGATLDEQQGYARLRSYQFGDLVVGTNGLGIRGLRSYFSTSFRFDNPVRQDSTPIPTVYDGNFDDFIIRGAWIDIEDVFERKLLAPLYFRVGKQYKYGVAVTHFDGLTVGYNTKAVRASLFTGSRAANYQSALIETGSEDFISGFDLSVDLYEIRRVPVVLTASSLGYDQRRHFEGSAALRLGRNSLVRAKVRTRGGKLAAESLRLRARLTQTTTINATLDNRHSSDWLFDYFANEETSDVASPKSTLNLGPPRPRARAAVRAGTVLLRNIDVLASIAGALEYADNEEFTPTSTRSSYIEAGSGLEVRVRRNIRVGVNGVGRLYRRPVGDPIVLTGGPDVLPEVNSDTGETSFVEGGATIRYSLGARVFNAGAELYGRRFRFQTAYDEEGERPTADLRTGGRFSIEGWATSRIRARLDYDLSLAKIRYAPELEGIKSLRIMIEGTF